MIRDFLDRVNVWRVVTSHLKTLTGPAIRVEDVRWSQLRGYDVLLFYGIPIGVGILAWRLGVELVNLEPSVVALILFATLLLTILFHTLTLVEDARDRLQHQQDRGGGWKPEQARRRLVMITLTYHNLAYLFLFSVASLTLVVVLESVDPPTAEEPLAAGWSAVIAAAGLHILLTLLLVLNRLYESLDTDVRAIDRTS